MSDNFDRSALENNILDRLEDLERQVAGIFRQNLRLSNLANATADGGDLTSITLGGQVLNADGIYTSATQINIQWWIPIALATDNITEVRAVAYDGTEYLYVGGKFTSIGGVKAAYIARYSTITREWSEYNGGVNNPVLAIAIDTGGAILIGGSFTDAGGVANADGIAKSSGATWAALGTGVSAGTVVYAITVDSANNYYAAGSFALMGGVANTSGVAKWTGAAWSAMGTGASAGGLALAVDSADRVYLGTNTTNIGGVAAADFIGVWSGGAWAGVATGTNSSVSSIAVDSTDMVYVGGAFTSCDPGGTPVAANYIAKFQAGTSTWQKVGTSGADVSTVRTISIDADDNVIIGGDFADVDSVENTSRIARWNGEAWEALSNGGGVTTVGGIVYASTVLPTGSIIMGGSFDYVGTINCTGLAMYSAPLNETIDVLFSLIDMLPKWGTYTPTLSNVTNVAASTAYTTYYQRVGKMVTVFGKVDIDPTAAGAIEMTMTLPFSSNLANEYELSGVAAASAVHQSIRIFASATDVARFIGTVTDIANRSYAFQFSYVVL